jgi:hypothetical protein
MESYLATVLFDLAFVAPPLAVLVGVLLLAVPSRTKHTADARVVAHAA